MLDFPEENGQVLLLLDEHLEDLLGHLFDGLGGLLLHEPVQERLLVAEVAVVDGGDPGECSTVPIPILICVLMCRF